MQRTQRPLPDRLARLNPTGVFLATLALVLVGLLTPGLVGGLVLLVLAVGLVGLMRLTWPVQTSGTRLFRLLMLSLLVAVALAKLL